MSIARKKVTVHSVLSNMAKIHSRLPAAISKQKTCLIRLNRDKKYKKQQHIYKKCIIIQPENQMTKIITCTKTIKKK